MVTGICLRQFGEVTVQALLPKTPIEIVNGMLLLPVALSSRRGLMKFTYIHTFYLPFIFLPVLFIGSMSLRNIEAVNLLPIFGGTAGTWSKELVTIANLSQVSFVIVPLVPR